MKKRREQSEPESCWNKARDDERVFVLLERDKATPATIRFWVEERIRLGKNQAGDAQLMEALMLANDMERMTGVI